MPKAIDPTRHAGYVERDEDRAQQRLLLFLLDRADARAKLERMRLTSAEYDALQCRVSGVRTQKRRLRRVDEAVALLRSCGFQP